MVSKRRGFLKNLVLAALMSEGYIDPFASKVELRVPYDIRRTPYLLSLIRDYSLEEDITILAKKRVFIIHHCEELVSMTKQWYKDERKIFSFVLDYNLINMEAIILANILFGTREEFYISIPTTIDKAFLKSISICISRHIDVPVIFKSNQINILNVQDYFKNVAGKLPAYHIAELITFLTESEKKRIREEISI
ncbi:hypothetical protein [Niallia sp. FSL R7-0271]|uniref:hypothetical protein n=1 Tax=Niallia sp. FSL R7-0271 TaxID=2921678 RepID=UPI0030F5A552